MKKSLILLVLVIGLVTSELYAQNYAFRVLVAKGQVKVKVADTKWEPLKTGVRLNKGDRIKLSDGNYVGLVHSSGKTLELKKSGVYDISDLSEKKGSNTKSIVSKYADFVISKMTPEAIEQNRKKYASTTGSGERGLYDTDIHLYLPKTIEVLNKRATFSWEYRNINATYIITLKNIFGEQILTTEVYESSYTINFDNDTIQNGLINDFITVEVRLKEDVNIKSQKAAVKWMDDEHSEALKATILELTASLGETSPLNNLILAEFYEEKGFILDAISSYEHAIILAPEIDFYKESYNEFLIRNELKKLGTPNE